MAGHEDFGHQEIYQHLAGVPRVLTMLLTTNLRVVHLTTHHPMRTAVDFVTRAGVLEALRLTRNFFAAHGCAHPRIGVAALNPHGGEAGLIGSEEIEEIRPAVADANAEGIAATGPVPADTVFGQAIEGQYDAVLAMYHDQGHVAVKVHDWASSITLNIGLPFLRISVDHGTAFDIAGKGIRRPHRHGRGRPLCRRRSEHQTPPEPPPTLLALRRAEPTPSGERQLPFAVRQADGTAGAGVPPCYTFDAGAQVETTCQPGAPLKCALDS